MSAADPSLSGVMTPLVTPFTPDLSIDHARFARLGRWSLAEGAHFLCPFGTTGEALSLSLRERRDGLERLAANGLPPDRLIPGVGLCNFEETLALTRHAVDLGCAGVLMLPPFFYTSASDEGLFAAVARIIEAAPPETRICLYNIPKFAGVSVSPAVSARLAQTFPEMVVAYKDSSGDSENTRAVMRAAPALAMFPGSEIAMAGLFDAGAAGCISATNNLAVGSVRRLYEALAARRAAGDPATPDALDAAVTAPVAAMRQALEGAGFIQAVKGLIAEATDAPDWARTRPPVGAPTPEAVAALKARVEAAAGANALAGLAALRD